MHTPVTRLSEKAILAKVILILEMITSERDTALSGGIGPDSFLVQDLDCDSLDLLAFGVQLEVCFDRRDLSTKLLMQEGRYRDDLSVRDVVSFIREELSNDDNVK
jgi:acyl carrier protein